MVGIILLAYLVLQIPAIQRKLTDTVVQKVGPAIGLQLQIEKVYPIFWKGIALQNVTACNLQGDTIMKSRWLYATVKTLQLDSSHVALADVSLSEPSIYIAKNAKGELNIASMLNALQSSDTTAPFRFEIDQVTIRNGRFAYRDNTIKSNSDFGVDFNNIALSDLFLQAHAFSIYNGSYNLSIEKFSCQEQSGLDIQYLHADAHVCDTLIQCKNIAIYTPESKVFAKEYSMAFSSFDDFSDFITKVHLTAVLNRTTITLHDIAYFASALKDFPYAFSVQGILKGTVSDFSAKQFHIGYGRSSRFVGDMQVTGLPNIDSTRFYIDAKELATNQYDISHTRIPPYAEEQYVQLPSFLEQIIVYKYQGVVEGVWNDLSTQGTLQTNAGNVDVDASLKQGETNICSGTVLLDEVDVSKFIASNTIIGKTSGTVAVEANFNPDSLISADVDGQIKSLQCNGYEYSNININGELSTRKFLGKIDVDDKNLRMQFEGGLDMSKTIPDFKFTASVDKANLDELNLIHDSLSNLSFSTKVDFSGARIDDMSGDVALYDVQYANASGSFSTKNITLHVSNDDAQRDMMLHSAFLDANISGTGQYKDLVNNILATLSTHISSLPKPKESIVAMSDFHVEVTVKNLNSILSVIQPDLKIAPGTRFDAVYTGADNVCSLLATSPQCSYKKIVMNDCRVDGTSSLSGLDFNLLYALDSAERSTNTAQVICNVVQDSLKTRLKWNYASSVKTKGELEILGKMQTKRQGELPKFLLEVQPTQMYFSDSLWNVARSNIVVDTSSIAISNFSLYKDAKKIEIDGTVSEDKDDYLVISVENYDLQEVSTLINNSKVRLSGPLHGTIRVKNMYALPLIFADVQSEAISFNDNVLGSLRIRSFWENKSKAMVAHASIKNGETDILSLDGAYTPETDSLSSDVTLTNLKLSTFGEIFYGTVNDISGSVSGACTVNGKISDLSYSGELTAKDGAIKVAYTNVPYSFSGKLKARNSRFSFSDFTLTDYMSNTATIHGFVDLKVIANPHYVIGIQSPKLIVMNTTAKDNDYFYGTIYYAGSARITGDLIETNISCNGKTLNNTAVSIPVTYSELSGQYDFLLFSADTTTVHNYQKTTSTSGLSLDLTIDVTPDALAQIIFDPKVGDIIKACGRGNLQVKMDPSGDLKMYGKYEIYEGDYLFTLKNLINKKLVIQKGGTIVWNGDPLNAQVDLAATYDVKASPQPLFDSTVNASKRITVTCQVNLKNNLLSPDISYNIDVPSSATQVSEVLATLSEDQKTLQFFSLLIQNSFMAINSDATGGASVSFEVLSNQVSNLLSQIDPNLDVNVNYHMGTNNATNNELEFGITRQFWHDRILVNVNGYTDFRGSETTAQSGLEPTVAQSQSSDFSGNVSVEMKLNKQGTIKVKGFSRSNDGVLTEKQENTQGVGFFFTKDFNSFKDLFKKEQE